MSAKTQTYVCDDCLKKKQDDVDQLKVDVEELKKRFVPKEAKTAEEEEAEQDALKMAATAHFSEEYKDRLAETQRLADTAAEEAAAEVKATMEALANAKNAEEKAKAQAAADQAAQASKAAAAEKAAMIAAKPFIGFTLVAGKGFLTIGLKYDGGPAHQVGLQTGDQIVSMGDSKPTTLDTFRACLPNECEVGDFTKLDVLRGTSKKIITIPVWVMTSDPKFAGKPFYFDINSHKKI